MPRVPTGHDRRVEHVSLSLSQLASHAAKALQQTSGPVTVAYSWPHAWNGGDTISVAGRELPLRHCVSPLELREALGAEDAGSRILLVSIPENRLGQDVLGRLFHHRLLHVDRWQLVQDAYNVHQIDPRLFPLNWMPDLLLASTPDRRTSSATVLTYDEAIESCLTPVLGIDTGQLDAESLLLACENSEQRWHVVAAEPQDLFAQYLVARLGALASAFLATMNAGNGHAILAIGLVCDVLYAPLSTQAVELRDARVRLEQRLNGFRLRDIDGKQWAELAKRLVVQRSPTSRQQDFKLAIELLDAIGAADFVWISAVLPESLDRRLDLLGNAVTKFMRSPDALPEVETAAQQVLAHELPPAAHPGPDCARMVARLCRYDAKVSAANPASDVCNDYVTHGAWEDRARRILRGARPEIFARAVTKLLDRVATRRMGSDEAFAMALAQTAAIGDVPAGLLPIESTLHALVAPVVQHNPLLMVVLDGMSLDVYLAIADSMTQRGWVSWSRLGSPLALLATTPSVTECSRASLLAGRLTRGVASQEKQSFAQHEDLKKASRTSRPPLLLHKAGLEESHQLNPEAARAIADPEQRVIGVVINAIDDALAKSEQVRIDWTIESIPLLAEVLEHARRAGRVVVLTSDHGHVLERQSTMRPDGEGERWRRPGRAPEHGEIIISGPRSNALIESPLVLPWSEIIRYAAKKNGYHGGVSRQEMFVPFGIWTSGSPLESDESEFYPSGPVAPAWWSSEEAVTPPAVRTTTRRSGSKAAPTTDLFSAPHVDDWLERLLASPLLQRQRERAGRMALETERLRSLLGKLQQQGGRCSIEQLATAIGQPTMRMRGVISAMERMLNLDGFPVVTLEQGTGTVLLDVPLLKAQFLT
jgi:hypothetical protein